MENWILHSFQYAEHYGEAVSSGQYDLLGPNRNVVSPQEWEEVIQPDMSITMRTHVVPVAEHPNYFTKIDVPPAAVYPDYYEQYSTEERKDKVQRRVDDNVQDIVREEDMEEESKSVQVLKQPLTIDEDYPASLTANKDFLYFTYRKNSGSWNDTAIIQENVISQAQIRKISQKASKAGSVVSQMTRMTPARHSRIFKHIALLNANENDGSAWEVIWLEQTMIRQKRKVIEVQAFEAIYARVGPKASADGLIVDERGNLPSSSLRVENLPARTTSNQIRRLFSNFGTIRSIRLVSKYAVVDFETVENAVAAFKACHRKPLFGANTIDVNIRFIHAIPAADQTEEADGVYSHASKSEDRNLGELGRISEPSDDLRSERRGAISYHPDANWIADRIRLGEEVAGPSSYRTGRTLPEHPYTSSTPTVDVNRYDTFSGERRAVRTRSPRPYTRQTILYESSPGHAARSPGTTAIEQAKAEEAHSKRALDEFVDIPLDDLARCGEFVASHPNVLSQNPQTLTKRAISAYKKGRANLADRRLQRALIIELSNRLWDLRQKVQYVQSLADKESSNQKECLEQFEKKRKKAYGTSAISEMGQNTKDGDEVGEDAGELGI